MTLSSFWGNLSWWLKGKEMSDQQLNNDLEREFCFETDLSEWNGWTIHWQSTDRRQEFHRVVANAVTAMRNIPKLYNFRSTSTFNPHWTSSPHTSPVDFSKCALHGFPDRSRLVNKEVNSGKGPRAKNSVYFCTVSFRPCLLGSKAPEKKGHILKSVIWVDWNI